MSKMNTKFKYMYDAAPEAALVPKDGVAKTASFNSAPLALDKILGYWNRTRAGVLNTLADQTVAIAVNVTGIKRSVGDEAYTLELEFGPTGLATSIKPQKLTVTQNGQYVFLVDIHTLKHMKSDIDVVRVAATLGGTAPSITLHSWLAGSIIQ